jgi:hypothetical protein
MDPKMHCPPPQVRRPSCLLRGRQLAFCPTSRWAYFCRLYGNCCKDLVWNLTSYVGTLYDTSLPRNSHAPAENPSIRRKRFS